MAISWFTRFAGWLIPLAINSRLSIVSTKLGISLAENKQTKMQNNVAQIVAFTENGFWSYAPTLPEVFKKLQKLGGKGNVSLSIVYGDAEPTVDQYGGISYGGKGKEDAYLITVGPVGTVTSVRRKLKELGYSL